MKTEIRRALKEDLPALALLEKEHEGYPAWGEKGLAAELEKSFSVVLLLKCEGETAGFMNFWIMRPRLELNSVVVSRKHLRKGCAGLLMNKMLEYAEKNGCSLIDLEVSEKNLPAITLYSKAGFREIGRRPKYYNNTYDALLMRMEIR